jgi:hypothetical protein
VFGFQEFRIIKPNPLPKISNQKGITTQEYMTEKPEDFQKQTQRVYDDSKIVFTVLK